MDSESENLTPMLTRSVSVGSSRKFYQYLAAITVSFGAFCAGTVLSWTSPALTHVLPSNETQYQPEKYPGFLIDSNQAGFIGSTVTFGALLMAIPIGYLSDKIGRKLVLLGLAACFLINWILIIFARNIETVLIARFFAGVGLGGICVVVPMYIGEISQPSNRGVFGSFFQLFLSLGILFTCVVGYFTNWLWLAIIHIVTPVIFGFSFAFMPETPTFLVKKNDMGKAEKNLQQLRGDPNVSTELKSIEMEILESQKSSVKMSDFCTKRNFKAIISVVGVLMLQQLCGINAIVFYTVNIFQAAGSTISPFIAAIITNSVQVVVSYISVFIIEKANRKFFLCLSSIGMLLCLATIGTFFHLKYLSYNLNNISFLPLMATVAFTVCFSIGYGPIPWMLLGELFSPEIKGIASGMAILANWLSAFLVTLLFPILNASYGEHVSFYILAMNMLLGTVFVYFVVPETRGKTFTEIQEKLSR